jgi:hypothetical protein
MRSVGIQPVLKSFVSNLWVLMSGDPRVAFDAGDTTPAKPRTAGWVSFKELAEVWVILGALIYAAGWNYLYAYYRSFGLTLKDVGPNSSDFLVFSIPVFNHSWWATLIIVVILGLAAYVLNAEWKWRQSTAIVTLFLSFLGLSAYASHVGYTVATGDMDQATTSLPAVRVAVENSGQAGPDFDKEELRLLIRTGGQIYVFQPINVEAMKRAGLPKGNIRVYVIPENRAREVRIERGPPSVVARCVGLGSGKSPVC